MPGSPGRRSSQVVATLVVLVLAAIAYLFVSQLRAASRHTADLQGPHVQNLARQAVDRFERYLARVVLDVELLTIVPDIQRAAVASNEQNHSKEYIRTQDKGWKQLSSSFPTAATSKDAARYLHGIVRLSQSATSRVNDGVAAPSTGIYREVILANAQGELVAASGATDDYDQSDDTWFEGAIGAPAEPGRTSDDDDPALYIGGVKQDDSTQAVGFEIALPLRDDYRRLGVLKVVLDPHEITEWLAAMGAGHGLQIGFVRDADGPVLRPGGMSLSECEKEFVTSRGVPTTCEGRYVAMAVPPPNSLLSRIGWICLVSEPFNEHPLRDGALLWFRTLSGFTIASLVLAVWLCYLGWRPLSGADSS